MTGGAKTEEKPTPYTCPECFKKTDALIVLFYERKRKWITASGSCTKCNAKLKKYIETTFRGRLLAERTLTKGREITAYGATYRAL